jgi:hypothetical protein
VKEAGWGDGLAVIRGAEDAVNVAEEAGGIMNLGGRALSEVVGSILDVVVFSWRKYRRI